jgi:hypothetical protein
MRGAWCASGQRGIATNPDLTFIEQQPVPRMLTSFGILLTGLGAYIVARAFEAPRLRCGALCVASALVMGTGLYVLPSEMADGSDAHYRL